MGDPAQGGQGTADGPGTPARGGAARRADLGTETALPVEDRAGLPGLALQGWSKRWALGCMIPLQVLSDFVTTMGQGQNGHKIR